METGTALTRKGLSTQNYLKLLDIPEEINPCNFYQGNVATCPQQRRKTSVACMGLGGVGQDVWHMSPTLDCGVRHTHTDWACPQSCREGGMGNSSHCRMGAWGAQQGIGEQEGHGKDLSAISSHDSYLPSGVRLFCEAASFPISPWDMVLCSLAWPSPEVNLCTVCNDSKHEAFKNKTALGISDDFFFPIKNQVFYLLHFYSYLPTVESLQPW